MNDLISRQAAIDAKQEFRNPNVVRDTEARTAYDRTYANGWNDCNSAWINAIKALPSAQPEKVCIAKITLSEEQIREAVEKAKSEIVQVFPSAQPEIIRCKDCIYYDPPHVENNGVRYEYDEMPADAFDALGTGLVNAEYGINIGGRCCVDYYCKHYSDDKRVFVREDNYCGRAERRTDGSD